MKKSKFISYMVAFIGVLMSATGSLLAGDVKAPPSIEVTESFVKSRLANLNRLINTSSGASRVKNSGNQEAENMRTEAARFLDQAREALGNGDHVAANAALNKATDAMFSAVRLVGAGAVATDKQKQDFKNRAESVDALLTALNRIAHEKGLEKQMTPILIENRKKVTEAWVLERGGEIEKGRKLLDQAYNSTKISIEHLRGGDTLVRSLDFASKEEEYHYEIDRNDTHQMLVRVLVSEKLESSPDTRNRVEPYLAKARGLRKQAEGDAARGEFAAAIEKLEQSTKEIVRAIRGAGVYIPG